eukprot:NODE_2666_length_1524_cov_39.663812_g2297_i0.p1 GENE.NODE_2666_length_1524_cov_39.663812_g2297_i0~~NODE_2666_length_1524_cov_39.663812_g2297_i0.p1  ORF type:complete len:454 (-),score=76.97 NODE_2666_length_1524_cov_39.663812_g2297_i0:53-1414(-)
MAMDFPVVLKSFISTASNVVNALDKMWTELGLAQKQRDDTLNFMMTEAEKIFNTALEECKRLRDNTYNDVLGKTSTHTKLCCDIGNINDSESSYSQCFTEDWTGMPLLSQLQRIEHKVNTLQSLKANREKLLNKAHSQLLKLHRVLDIPIQQSASLKGNENFFGSDLSLIRLSEYNKEISSLTEMKRDYDEKKIKTMWQNIHNLWASLHISEVERSIFCTKIAPLENDLDKRDTLIDMMENQVQSLQKERQRRWDDLVRETTNLLLSLWNEYYNKTGQKADMPIPAKGTEENIALIEGLVVEMEDKLKQVDDVCKLCEKRQQLLDEEAELMEAQKDPDRLLNKKRNMASQLLKEEKIRNSIKKDLPKIESKIYSFCVEWQEQHGSAFTYHGQPLLQILTGEPIKPNSNVRPTPSPPAQVETQEVPQRRKSLNGSQNKPNSGSLSHRSNSKNFL